MIGQEKRKSFLSNHGDDDLAFANELNIFFVRFETSDFKTERNLIRLQLNAGQEVIITSEEVCRTLKRVNKGRHGVLIK